MASKGRRVLLVDDNQADIDLTKDTLSHHRFISDVRTVPDGVEAMAYLQRIGRYRDTTTPDLMILDLNLPRKDGRAVLRAVKSDPALRKIPIVMFTTSESQHDIETSYALGANSYVSKPANLTDYVSSINSLGDYWFGTAQLPEQEEK